MGQVLHRSATTTEVVRRAIQHSQESMRSLARRHGINPKTVAKWKKRESTVDRRTGPTVPRSTVLTVEQEATVLADFLAGCLNPTVSSIIQGNPKRQVLVNTFALG
jgi:transposase-like protein